MALIEAAIIFPFLALLFLGMVEAGFAYRDGNALARATQQAARSDARQANNPTADYEALRSLQSGLAATTASSVERVIVYNAAGFADSPPPSCLALTPSASSPVGISGLCNVYSAAQVASDQPGQFGCAGGWDSNFCPTNPLHRVRTGANPTRLGLWVELSFDEVTKVLPGSLALTRAAVYQIEPCIAGDTSC